MTETRASIAVILVVMSSSLVSIRARISTTFAGVVLVRLAGSVREGEEELTFLDAGVVCVVCLRGVLELELESNGGGPMDSKKSFVSVGWPHKVECLLAPQTGPSSKSSPSSHAQLEGDAPILAGELERGEAKCVGT